MPFCSAAWVSFEVPLTTFSWESHHDHAAAIQSEQWYLRFHVSGAVTIAASFDQPGSENSNNILLPPELFNVLYHDETAQTATIKCPQSIGVCLEDVLNTIHDRNSKEVERFDLQSFKNKLEWCIQSEMLMHSIRKGTPQQRRSLSYRLFVTCSPSVTTTVLLHVGVLWPEHWLERLHEGFDLAYKDRQAVFALLATMWLMESPSDHAHWLAVHQHAIDFCSATAILSSWLGLGRVPGAEMCNGKLPHPSHGMSTYVDSMSRVRTQTEEYYLRMYDLARLAGSIQNPVKILRDIFTVDIECETLNSAEVRVLLFLSHPLLDKKDLVNLRSNHDRMEKWCRNIVRVTSDRTAFGIALFALWKLTSADLQTDDAAPLKGGFLIDFDLCINNDFFSGQHSVFARVFNIYLQSLDFEGFLLACNSLGNRPLIVAPTPHHTDGQIWAFLRLRFLRGKSHDNSLREVLQDAFTSSQQTEIYYAQRFPSKRHRTCSRIFASAFDFVPRISQWWSEEKLFGPTEDYTEPAKFRPKQNSS